MTEQKTKPRVIPLMMMILLAVHYLVVLFLGNVAKNAWKKQERN